MLISGFIRRIEKLLSSDKIIPNGITLICQTFYSSNLYIFFLAQNLTKHPNKLYLTNLNDTNSTTHCNIHQLPSNKTPETWVINNAGVCTTKNMEIPRNIHQSICKQVDNNKLSNDYNIIYKCCGNLNGFKDYCSAILINTSLSKSDSHDNGVINAYNWELPKYIQPIDFNITLFSSKYTELYNIGGWSCDKIGKLGINENTENIGWELLSKMITTRSSPAAVLLNDSKQDRDAQKLMVIGGYIGRYQWDKTVNLYNFEDKSWIECAESSIGQYGANAYWDKIMGNMYFGGGDQTKGRKSRTGSGSCMEHLNLEKDKWIELPDTNMEHKIKPVIWIDDVNMLYVSSSASNWIECIDLRENKNVWEKALRIDKVFGISAPTIASAAQLVI